MRRLPWIAIPAATLVAVGASCIPDFKFASQSDSDGGDGGNGGSGAGGGSSSSGGSGGEDVAADAGPDANIGPDAAPNGPTVPCGDNGASKECAPGQVCCYHTMTAACDKCGLNQCVGESACAGVYAKMECNSGADCPTGTACCATLEGQQLKGIQCQPGCTTEQRAVCTEDAECGDAGPCVALTYPGYKLCGGL